MKASCNFDSSSMAAELCLVEGVAAASGDWAPPQLTAAQLHWLSRHIKALAEVSMTSACFTSASPECQHGGHSRCVWDCMHACTHSR